MAIKKGLGRGLSALLSDSEQEYDLGISEEPTSDSSTNETNTPTEISISQIEPNVNQPRTNFDEAALIELANSIRMHGVISPLILVKSDNGKYMIIAGERRWRAAKRAGLLTVPAIVRDYTPLQIKEISLIDNLQREDLNPIETARAIKQLMSEYNYTQEQVADRIGKSRPAVANNLRLLNLSAPVIDLVEKNLLSSGHARCLVPITDAELQYKLANEAVSSGISVRDFEKLIKKATSVKVDKPAPVQSIELKDMVNRMQRVFATKVSVLGNDNKGRIYIDYYNRDDLDRIIDILTAVEDK
ncbi:MAG: ParB/RepB/Spo0J family partition protein [Firmicutes bacterium]|nr:ParB/RepB/Spo0J family partition protein [Bacillota bacterium]MDY5531183.1 ParB/RepB/Spo0J family partition protein [Pumilibacteraceae bacterium]